MQTPLCYMGGKQRLAGDLVHALPEHGVYVEPFAGGLAVLFAKRKAPLEVVNDLDSTVATFWRVLRDYPERLKRLCENTPISRAEFELAKQQPVAYKTNKVAGVEFLVRDDVETARRLFVRYDQSYSSGGRGWSWRNAIQGNRVPRLEACAERLKGVLVENRDALKLIPEWDVPGALIYCDPPYHPDTRDPNLYEKDVDIGFSSKLVGRLNELQHAVYVLSAYAHPVFDEGLDDVECFTRTQNKDTSAKKGSKGKLATETIYAPRGVLAWQRAMF